MGGIMGGAGTMGAWMLLWVLLAIALATAGGVLAARVLAHGRTGKPELPSADPPAIQQAKDALRRRYASGEISREDYLQGKVELED